MTTTAYKASGTQGGTAAGITSIALSDDVRSSHNTAGTVIATNFTFGLPAGATIDGVEVNVESSAVSGQWTQTVQLYDTVPIGTTESTAAISSTVDAVRAYGGAAVLWGATLTPAIVNSSTFGVQVTATRESGNGGTRFGVDFIEMRINYTFTPPAGRTYVRVGGSMVPKTTKARIGGTQVSKTLKVRVSGVFI